MKNFNIFLFSFAVLLVVFSSVLLTKTFEAENKVSYLFIFGNILVLNLNFEITNLFFPTVADFFYIVNTTRTSRLFQISKTLEILVFKLNMF